MDQGRATTKAADGVLARVAEDSSFDRAYVVMNVLATIVACYGLLQDSAAVVIGAMIIAMLLGPIAGVGLSLVDGDNKLLRKASASLAGGVLLVVITAFVVGVFNPEIPATTEMLTRTSPNLFDLLIALGGGAAGAYAVIYRRVSVAFVGVAIATALVPPLATASMFLARRELALSGGAFLLAFANIVGIQFACSAVFFLSGFRGMAARRMSGGSTFVANGVSIGALLILGVLLTLNLHGAVAKQLYENAARSSLKAALLKYPGSYLADLRFSRDAGATTIRATVRGPEGFTAEQVADMESKLPTLPGQTPSVLVIRYVHATVMSAKGQLFSAGDSVVEETKP